MAVPLQAVTLDLRYGADDGKTINGAVFGTGIGPGGTGVFGAFLKMQTNKTTVQGYNTGADKDLPPILDDIQKAHTHDLSFSSLKPVTVGGIDYYQFLLDIDQEGDDPFLSLDTVKIYTSPTASLKPPTLAGLGTLRYDMDGAPDGDSEVLLNAGFLQGPGSGKYDMYMDVPVSLFAGVLSTDYVYLYCHFGAKGIVNSVSYENNDGPEEWAARIGGDDPGGGGYIPEPATMAGLLLAVGAAGGYFRRRLRLA